MRPFSFPLDLGESPFYPRQIWRSSLVSRRWRYHPGKKTRKKDPPEVPDDPLSQEPEFAKMVEDVSADSPVGEVKIQLKPQSKRSPIAVLMFKGPGDKKFSQKLQIVVKPPTVLGIDAMAILKFIAAEFLDGDINVDSLKDRKAFLVGCLEKNTLLAEFEKKKTFGVATTSTEHFVDIYKKRVERAIVQPENVDPPTAASASFFNEENR